MNSKIPNIVEQNRKRYSELESTKSNQWRQAYCGERNWIHEQLWPVNSSGSRTYDPTDFILDTQEKVAKMLEEIG